MTDVVVGLGAWCDAVPEDESTANPGSASFDVHEFAVLADGRRITVHSGERGFSASGPRRPTADDPLAGMTAAEIESWVLTTVLPDEDDGEEHPWEWLAELLDRQGVQGAGGVAEGCAVHRRAQRPPEGAAGRAGQQHEVAAARSTTRRALAGTGW